MHEVWEVKTICPHCGHEQVVHVPVGEQVVVVKCIHCPHDFNYVHVVREYKTVEDDHE